MIVRCPNDDRRVELSANLSMSNNHWRWNVNVAWENVCAMYEYAHHARRIGLTRCLLSPLRLGQPECAGNTADALQACQPSEVVGRYEVQQCVEPAMQRLRLWPAHGHDESWFRDWRTELNT